MKWRFLVIFCDQSILMDYEKINQELAALKLLKRDDIYKDDKSKESFYKRVDAVIKPFKNRLDVEKKRFVHIVNINAPVVSRRLASFCAYTNGYYLGTIYVDKRGNIFGNIDDVYKMYGENTVLCAGGNLGDGYAQAVYVPEIESVLIGTIGTRSYLDASRFNEGKEFTEYIYDGEKHYWLLDKNMYILGNNRGCACYIKDTNIYGMNQVEGFEEAIKKLTGLKYGIVNVGGNSYIPLNGFQNLLTFLSYKAKLAYKSGKIQKKIDELVAAKKFDTPPMVDRLPHEYNNLICKTNINKINDNLCVIRWTYSYRDECFDGMRVYIDGNDVYACKSNNEGQFIRVALSTLNQKNFTAEYNSDIEMDDMTGTRLEWYASIINTLPEKYRMTLLMMFLTDIKMEQLVKLGFGDSICQKLTETVNNIGPTVRLALKVNKEMEDSKNIYRWIGVNKYQLNQIIESCKKRNASEMLIRNISDIKDIFGSDDISSYDNQMFDGILEMYERYCESAQGSWYKLNMFQISKLISDAASADETGVFKNNMLRYVPQLTQFIDWSREYFNMYSDFISMVTQMGIRQKVKLYPTSKEDLRTKHDSVSAVFNLKKNQYQKHAFMTRMIDLKKMEYENEDFEFCVKCPEVPEDLAVEGLELHHCVKSYIDRVSKGQTNILFIRKKDDVDKPFFTVELTTDKVIAQVHGFANRNADTEPGMIEFVHRWARNKRLKIGAFNSVRG